MWKIVVKYTNNTTKTHDFVCYNEAVDTIQWEIDHCGEVIFSIELIKVEL